MVALVPVKLADLMLVATVTALLVGTLPALQEKESVSSDTLLERLGTDPTPVIEYTDEVFGVTDTVPVGV